MITVANPFYVTIMLLTNGLYKHKFFFGSDLRFHKDLPCVDASAIDAWCSSNESYKRVHINW